MALWRRYRCIEDGGAGVATALARKGWDGSFGAESAEVWWLRFSNSGGCMEVAVRRRRLQRGEHNGEDSSAATAIVPR